MAARRKGFLSPIAEEKAQDGDAKVHTSSDWHGLPGVPFGRAFTFVCLLSFEHSLGVCYLAGKWVDHFREVQASQNMIDFALEKNQISLVEYGLDAKDIVFIKELIDPPKNLRRHARGRGASKSFLYEIVSNKICGLDVDKLMHQKQTSIIRFTPSRFDYFQRDRFFTAFYAITFPHTWPSIETCLWPTICVT
eukprot:jgi/Bigna1/79116/fgenesh1_pg.59_\